MQDMNLTTEQIAVLTDANEVIAKDESGSAIGWLTFTKMRKPRPKSLSERSSKRSSEMSDVRRRLMLLKSEIDSNGELTREEALNFVRKLRDAERAK